jgi:hypothetical protein
MRLALAQVPVVIFLILKKQNEVLALGYVVYMGWLETATYIAMVTLELRRRSIETWKTPTMNSGDPTSLAGSL